MRVIKARGLNPGEVEPLTGIDSGQGFLKVGMIINDLEENDEPEEGTRAKYSEVKILIRFKKFIVFYNFKKLNIILFLNQTFIFINRLCQYI